VEAVEEVGDLDRHVRVAAIEAVEPHPHRPGLFVCRLDLGDGRHTVVSAAPGLAAGMRVAVALAGATLPGGTRVAAADVGGVASDGMLCSESMLELGDVGDHALELPGVIPGTALRDLPGVRDTVVELEITANRGDLLSMRGVARDVAAVLGARVRQRRVAVREGGAPAADAVRVRIEAPDLCPRYAARLVRGVRVGPSPLSDRLRLLRAGMRPVNGVVDATNLVMLEWGQPLHAFDAARIADGLVIVRRARRDETLVTLDGVERRLGEDDLVIADPRGPLAVAGVMGGQASEVTQATRDVVLESAFFLPAAVRRTGRRLGLASQAAYRFERRVDPAGVPAALDVVAAAVVRLAGGRVAPGRVEEAPGADALTPKPFRLRPARVAGLLGVPLGMGELRRRLAALGMALARQGEAVMVTPPSWRSDLAIEEDVAEEAARLGGYDAIPVTVPLVPAAGADEGEERQLVRRIRRLLAAEGLSEMVTLSLIDPESNRVVGSGLEAGREPVRLANPLSSELSELRRSPLVGLLRAARSNRSHGASFVGAFEVGTGFGREGEGGVRERRIVAGVLCGDWPPRGVERSGPPIAFADLKGVVQNLLAGLVPEEETRWRPASDVALLHPGKAARIVGRGRLIGIAGALHPGIAQALDLAGEVWVFELDFEDLAHYGPRRVGVRPLPRFPAVTRDIAVVVDDAFLAETIVEEIRALADPLVESVTLFDRYLGAPIPDGHASLAYTVAYRAADRTLTDEEVNAAHERVRAHLSANLPLTLRS
jgi:phenylalanyl-tRNA synthetase beta chain